MPRITSPTCDGRPLSPTSLHVTSILCSNLLEHQDVVEFALLVREDQPARCSLFDGPDKKPALAAVLHGAIQPCSFQLVKPAALRGLLVVLDKLDLNRDLVHGDLGGGAPVVDIRVERQRARTAAPVIECYRQTHAASA